MNPQRLKYYAYLMRLHKPVGILLLLWPTLWAVWLAANGEPRPSMVFIFTMGVIIMRSAGCVINDLADRKWDGFVDRTKARPLVTGKISPREAIVLFIVLMTAAFVLVLFLNKKAIILAFIGAILAVAYPYLKRFTHLPQMGLGVAFAWSVPMAFAAKDVMITSDVWLLFFAAALWPIIYDTMYAMVDREDDIKAGIKSTAILFGKWDNLLLGILQAVFLWMLFWVGIVFKLHLPYYLSLAVAALFFVYQQWLIRGHEPENCFKAFLNNQWVGLVIFIGIWLSYAL